MVAKLSPRDLLKHTQVPKYPAVHLLGQMERRVTIYSQQVRALNLIYALHESQQIRRGSRIAVIGGGISGLTAAAAAAHVGCQVTLLEKQPSLLHLQRQCSKRWVHPHIYDWPRDHSLDGNANLPLLSWSAGTAESVANQIISCWEEIATKSHINVVLNVSDVSLSGETSSRLQSVAWNPHLGRGDFDTIVMAVGFGIERSFPSLADQSYWRDDDLDQADTQEPRSILVSGYGDGGLTDVLRACIVNFRHEDVIRDFRLDPSKHQEAFNLARLLLDIESSVDTIDSDEIRAKKITDSYATISDNITSFVDEELRNRFTKRRVVLNGPGTDPLTPHTSIINRFFISRLLRKGYASLVPVRIMPSDIEPAGKKWKVQFSSGKKDTFDRIIIRHGASSALEDGFRDIVADAYIIQHRNDLDQTRMPIWPQSFYEKPASSSDLKPKSANTLLASEHISVSRATATPIASSDGKHSPVLMGNILGELTAEADDQMLQTAFCESRNYRELVGGSDFRFVVGRRGTGKSALCKKTVQALNLQKSNIIIEERPDESIVISWHNELDKIGADYIASRRVTRLTWKIQILSETLERITEHYKTSKLKNLERIDRYRSEHADLFKHNGTKRSLEAFRQVIRSRAGLTSKDLPEALSDHYEIEQLSKIVESALDTIQCDVRFVYDGLDEGWLPTSVATGLLGGLAKAASELRESGSRVHCLLFVRDNMFRALAQFDNDFTRNIEGNALRLHWDDTTLLNLVALRLRAAFKWTGENDIRIWNRFAKRDLTGKDGFIRCLKHTLYRPRDLISLLNSAFQAASNSGRQEIIDDDIATAARRVSENRLNDLYKEYTDVLPGLANFAEVFRSKKTSAEYKDVIGMLQEVIDSGCPGAAARDFSLLRTGPEAFAALYSVGFVGVQEQESVRFCHDGSSLDIGSLQPDRNIVIHPCYWQGLNLAKDDLDSISISVDDEDDMSTSDLGKRSIVDLRLKKLGTIIGELSTIPCDPSGDSKFASWVFDAVRYLFSQHIRDIRRRPATGTAPTTITGDIADGKTWKKLRIMSSTDVVVIQPVNKEAATDEDFRHAWASGRSGSGCLTMIVTRAHENSGWTPEEQAHLVDGYTRDTKIAIPIPARLLSRALRKMQGRSERRDDYIEAILSKQVEKFVKATNQRRTKRTKK